MPWHKIQADQEVPHIVGAPKKRTPIRGKWDLTDSSNEKFSET